MQSMDSDFFGAVSQSVYFLRSKAANMLLLSICLFQLVPFATPVNYEQTCWMPYKNVTIGKDFPGDEIPYIVGKPRHIVRYGKNFGTIDPDSKIIEPLGKFDFLNDPTEIGKVELLFIPAQKIEWYSILDIFRKGLPANALAVDFANETKPEFICRPRWYSHYPQEIEPLGITYHAKSGASNCTCRKRVSGGAANQPLYDIALLGKPVGDVWPEKIQKCSEL